MSAVPIRSSSGFYVVGGTMRADSGSYVIRDADDELYNALIENEFCHVLTARQMGKSSLMLRTAARLSQAGIGVAALDLTGIGTNLSPEQWYSGLVVQLGDRLNIEDELLEFWWANLALGPMQRWISAIRKVVLPLHPGRLVIFIDEVDAVASLDFSTDEFFSGIRECYNLRNENADINRLTFCLLGVASPADLIRDTRTTPFNVGRRIELTDFKEAEALRLARGLGRSEAGNQALLRRILYWTNGHPYLTQRLCQAAAQNGADGNIRDIDESIGRMFVSKHAQEYDDNLIFVRERLLRSGPDVTAILNLYARVRQRKKVADDDSQPLVSILKLSGVTRSEDGVLRVSNRIYQRVFNGDWIKQNLPGAELRRQRAAFRRGVIRTMAVAGVILAIMATLAIIAFRQRNLAVNQIARNKKLVYLTSMEAAHQEYEKANIPRMEKLVSETMPQAGDEDLREFEWFLFWRYAHAEALRITEPGHIASAKFFSGDDTIAIAEVIHTMVQQKREYLIKLYDRKLQKETMSYSLPAGTNFDVAVFSADEKYIATDAPDKSISLWDLSSRHQIRSFPGTGRPVLSVVFAPDQEMIAGAFVGGTVRVWDVKSGKEKFEEHSQLEKPGLAFSPDGKQLAVGMADNAAAIIDIETGRVLRSFSTLASSLGLLFFSPDGISLFATNADGQIHSWKVRDGQPLNFVESHSNEVISFSFSPDGKTLATGSVDRTVRLWDISTGRELRKILGHGGWVTSLHWSAQGQYLLSADSEGLIKMWDLNLKELPVWSSLKPVSISAVVFTPDNELIAIGRTSDGDLKLWNLSNGQALVDLGHIETISTAAFSKDVTMVAAAVPPNIRIYSVITGKLISTLATSAENVYSLNFSPDGTRLLSGDIKGNVIISEVLSGRVEARLDDGNMYYRAVFSPDAKRIASADQDGKVRIWDVATGTISRTLTGHDGVVKLISFSPDGHLLATGADDNTVRIWDTASGESKTLAISNSAQRLAFSPDGNRLVTASLEGTIVLWDVVGAQEVVTLRQSGGRPTWVSFSSDGLTLAVSDEDGAVMVWRGAKPAN
jgi:WD40 repeat protein